MAMEEEDKVKVLDEEEISILKAYNRGPYAETIKKLEKDVSDLANEIHSLVGIQESDTGLAPVSQWDLNGDKRLMEEQPLLVSRCVKAMPEAREPRYVISIKEYARFVAGKSAKVDKDSIQDGTRIGVDRGRYEIKMALPPKIDPSVSVMQVEEKPDVTYKDIGGCKEQIERIREVVELPMLHPEAFENLGIDPPKGVLLYGPPGTGKTLLARAVANRTESTFVRVIGSELVQKYVGEGAKMVRDLFDMAKSKKSCIIFFDEIDAVGGTRFQDDTGESEVQRTMLELINQLDGFDKRGNIKVLMATNRPDTLDPALVRPGRLDRKIEFGLPDIDGRSEIFKIHTKPMSVAKDIRYDLLARLTPNATGADIQSVCTEAGMFAIRARRKVITERDFLDAIDKVIKGYQKFSATPKYLAYN
ncbi:26S protease regulatory subunit, putative [Entamoeba invadens IP1]|uniref:26S protease regulatory subunit, putative n=1 Tax=Entamoeba invadens IP1 TaxID=370355 RepID=A0A0A1U186_ENTIV|nr:26S protease regulatory subunit, putative [Entamoeba invadens IP1]ELP86271.1 26S protease regulatory subunit, putative [Entamoeba invadens IP1]|eukprot:XP_004185617.1 26S protease regulatory subunit, putative [Entamoeba invadens IP1]